MVDNLVGRWVVFDSFDNLVVVLFIVNVKGVDFRGEFIIFKVIIVGILVIF